MRPVICTTATTILAMTPLALSRNEGSEIWVPFAVTVIGGLFVGTVITIIDANNTNIIPKTKLFLNLLILTTSNI